MNGGPSESIIVDLSIPTTAFEIGEILRPPPDIEIELVEFVPISDGVIPYLWVTNHTPVFGEYVRQVRSDERVNDFRFVHAEGGRRLIRVDWEGNPDGFLDACLATDAIVEHGEGTHERWTFQLRFLNHADLTSFHRLCTDADVPLDIHRIMNPGRGEPPNQYGLTDSQREALLLARERGYFATPREVTMEELGEELGITRQAVAYRLRDGILKLVDKTLCTPNFDD
jgi:predicted DNA binding protein